LSLDLPQILGSMNRSRTGTLGQQQVAVVDDVALLPLAQLESFLKINIKDDLVPLLGSEVVISMPVSFLEDGPRRTAVIDTDTKESQESSDAQPQVVSGPSFVVALALKDREGMRTLLPKIVDSLGFKGASSLAQTERREDTEIVSYGNMFSYAFV